MLKNCTLLKVGAMTLAVAIVSASVVEAQGRRGQQGPGQGQRGPGGVRGGGPGGVRKLSLVSIEQVQVELNIAEEQMFFIDELLRDHREKSQELSAGIDFQSLREKPEEERQKLMEDLRAKQQKLVEANEPVLSEFLSNAQNKRLDEIVLQLQGIRALTDEDVAKELGLSGDQQKRIKEALDASDEERQKLMAELRPAGGDRGQRGGGPGRGGDRGPEAGGDRGQRGGGAGRGGDRGPEAGGDRGQRGGGRGGRGGDRGQGAGGGNREPRGGGPGGAEFTEMREKMEALRTKSEESVLAVLSPEQKKKFDDVQGEPFALTRGGRGGQPGGGRDQGGRPDQRGGGRGPGADGNNGGTRPRRPTEE